MPRGPEHDPLRGYGGIRSPLVIGIDERGDVDENRCGGGLACERVDLGHVAPVYFTMQRFAFQMFKTPSKSNSTASYSRGDSVGTARRPLMCLPRDAPGTFRLPPG